MPSLGQLTSLPSYLDDNPFYRLLVKFSRYKTGSFEWLFTAERYMVRYAWAALILMCILTLPHLEEVDVVADIVRLSTLVYPCLFIWSLTRLSGVELIQLVLEGHWTSEVLASPVTNRDLTHGFITPILLILRQYVLISVFSLAFYCVESSVVVKSGDQWILDDLWRTLWVSFAVFFNTIAWIVFVYMARLFAEVRLRNGLLKGLASMALLLGGLALLVFYIVLFVRYPHQITHSFVVGCILSMIGFLVACSAWICWKVTRHFRRYLRGQLGIDLLIYDDIEPYATAWCKLPPAK